MSEQDAFERFREVFSIAPSLTVHAHEHLAPGLKWRLLPIAPTRMLVSPSFYAALSAVLNVDDDTDQDEFLHDFWGLFEESDYGWGDEETTRLWLEVHAAEMARRAA